MMRLRHQRTLVSGGHPIVLRLILVTGTCLLLLACGTDSSAVETTTASANQLPVATAAPVPTTAPLSLPPADVALPALAPLPGSVADPAPATEPAAVVSSPVSVTSEAVAPEAVAPEVAAPDVAAPEAITTEPQEPADVTVQDSVAAVASADQWSDCLLAAAYSSDAAALLDPLAAGTTTDLTSVQLNTLAAASTNCGMVASTLALTAIGGNVATAESCLNAWLESSGGGSVFVGLASIGWNQPTPAWAQAHLVDALDGCFTGATFAADVMAVVAADPTLVGAFDAGCLATSFDASGTMRVFAQTLAANPAAADLSVGLDDAWVLACANVGQMVAVAAAADGVALSTSTISCIDSELKNAGAVASLIAGTADTEAVGIATIACLTDTEATALLG